MGETYGGEREHGMVAQVGKAATRRGVLKGAGLLGVGAVAGRVLFLRSAAQEADLKDVQPVLDTAITAEAVAVTFIGVGRQLNDDGKLDLKDVTDLIEAIQCEDQAHYNYFEANGGTATSDSITVPADAVKDKASFLQTAVNLKSLTVGLYMAAARRFAAAGHLDLVEIAYQIGAVEAQHLALLNAAAGTQPGNNRAFAEWKFADVSAAASAISDAGFIGGGGTTYTYPGPVDPVCHAIFGLVPEVTPAEATPSASPVASPGATPAAIGTPAS